MQEILINDIVDYKIRASVFPYLGKTETQLLFEVLRR